MKILCIGGSNLVMRHGISAAIPASLAAAGLPASTVENLSVGGTGSLFGWERLHRHEAATYDLVLIDYGITDFFVRRNDPIQWRAGFTGLLQAVRQRFPSALVVNLLLGRGDPDFWAEQALLHEDMRQEAAAQGVHTLDVDSHLKQERFRAVFPLLYQEYNHYAVPLGTEYVSQYCALRLVDLLQRHRTAASSTGQRPPAQRQLHVTPVPGTARTFTGSLFEWKAQELQLGQRITLEVPGVPVGLSMVAVAPSCAVHIRTSSAACIVNTSTIWTQQGRYPFIVAHAPLHGLAPVGGPSPASTTVELTVVDSQSPLWDPRLLQNHGYPEGRADEGGASSTAPACVYLDALSSWTRDAA